MSDPLATVYPTGIRLIDELTEFMAQRLPGMFGPVPEGPSSLDEDWWIEDRLAEGHHFPLARMSQREGLRATGGRVRGRGLTEDMVIRRQQQAYSCTRSAAQHQSCFLWLE